MAVIYLTLRDLKNAGYCAAGVRNWASTQNLDFRDFVKNGMTDSDLRGIVGDAITDRVIAAKEGV